MAPVYPFGAGPQVVRHEDDAAIVPSMQNRPTVRPGSQCLSCGKGSPFINPNRARVRAHKGGTVGVGVVVAVEVAAVGAGVECMPVVVVVIVVGGVVPGVVIREV